MTQRSPIIKRVKRKESPSPKKHPHGAAKVSQLENQPIVWRVGILDKEGPWGWGSVPSDKIWGDIHLKMKDFESMTFDEIMRGGGSHFVSCSDLSKEAKDRLEEISQDDLDELFSLRLGNKPRIWGVRIENIFKILWWDPNHEICPSHKKHT